jgi:MFS family permease
MVATSASFLPVYPLTIWAYHRLPHHKVLIGAVLLLLFGSWIRVLSQVCDDSFYPVFVGQILVALTCSPIQSAVTIIGNMWFPDHQRDKAVAIASLGPPLGAMIGLMLSGVIVGGLDTNDY